MTPDVRIREEEGQINERVNGVEGGMRDRY